MAKWTRTCNEFKSVREMIEDGDINGIMESLIKICDKYANGNSEFADDFRDLSEEMTFAFDEDFDEEQCDYFLDEFYDLCDNAGIWLGV